MIKEEFLMRRILWTTLSYLTLEVGYTQMF